MAAMSREQFNYIMQHRMYPAVGRIRMDQHQGREYDEAHLSKAMDAAYEDFMTFLDGKGPAENGLPNL